MEMIDTHVEKPREVNADELEVLRAEKKSGLSFAVLVLGFLAIFILASIGWSGRTSSNVKAVLSALSLFGMVLQLFWLCAYSGMFERALSKGADCENAPEALKRAKISVKRLNSNDHAFEILSQVFFVVAAALLSL